ncbi:MAG: hypothetical protein EOP06_10495 [Proteobacteria bacterium]|nr:MAG: hypothetical protein EOP06_10495 [Pseudomonadota bacterium]
MRTPATEILETILKRVNERKGIHFDLGLATFELLEKFETEGEGEFSSEAERTEIIETLTELQDFCYAHMGEEKERFKRYLRR